MQFFDISTIYGLWDALGTVPLVEDETGTTVIDDPDGFLGWPMGTDVEEIWRWFDEAFKDYGGVAHLMNYRA